MKKLLLIGLVALGVACQKDPEIVETKVIEYVEQTHALDNACWGTDTLWVNNVVRHVFSVNSGFCVIGDTAKLGFGINDGYFGMRYENDSAVFFELSDDFTTVGMKTDWVTDSMFVGRVYMNGVKFDGLFKRR